MPRHDSSAIRRQPVYESVDKFFAAITISFLLHLIALTLVYLYSTLTEPPVLKFPEKDAYVVYLVDPGKFTEVSVPKSGKRSRPGVATGKMQMKKVVKPKKIAPLTKKVDVVKKKIEVEQKAIKRGVKETAMPAKEYKKVKKGGAVDIRKFPYPWYIRIMTDKINRKWDTLSMDFFTDRPVHVTVYFKVDRQGKVGNLYVEQPSLNDAIDISAMDAVRLSSPLPPLPPGYKEDVLEVHFGFRLEAVR